MREELRDNEVTEVTGGTVVLSIPLRMICFNSIPLNYRIKGDGKEMRNRLLELYDENETMNEKEFDLMVMNEFLAKGWI